MLWTDNMQIPVGAPHAYTAEKMMDFVYQPEIQAPITAYVNYVPPVKGVKEILEKTRAGAHQERADLPDDESSSSGKSFRDLKPDEETELDNAFQKVIGA